MKKSIFEMVQNALKAHFFCSDVKAGKSKIITTLFFVFAVFTLSGQWTTTPSPTLTSGNAIITNATDVGATTGNLFFGGITFPALQNGMRMSYFNGNTSGFIDVRTDPTTPYNGLIFRADLTNGAAGNERMRLGANGNVGIGTTGTPARAFVSATIPALPVGMPYHKLHVHQGVAMLSGANAFGGPMMVFSSNLTTHPNGNWGIEYEPTERGLNFWKPFGNAGPGLAGNFYMFLSDDDGAVSIGTKNSPTSVGTGSNANNTTNYRLFVKGGILTDELLVQTGWADYVFNKSYKLPTLAEVEKHIADKGHLPNVPSEKDVVENGLNVGKMATTQQEKIEELFLYVIQLNKDIQALRADNETLRKMLNTQKPVSNEK